VGTRHVLFPRSLAFGAQLHPLSVAGCQFPDAAPDLHGRLQTVLGPAAEPAIGVATAGISGETSQPAVRTPAGALPPDPVRTQLRSVSPAHFRKVGIEAFRRRSLALRHGSCLLPLKLPFSSQPDDAVFDASRLFGSYCRPVVIASLPAPPNRIAQSAMTLPFFQVPAATPDPFDGFSFRP
jgi:hypothetical protein